MGGFLLDVGNGLGRMMSGRQRVLVWYAKMYVLVQILSVEVDLSVCIERFIGAWKGPMGCGDR